jgi:hypothetical protein
MRLRGAPANGDPPNLWPANTANCLCGHSGNQDRLRGCVSAGWANSGKLVVGNPGSGAVRIMKCYFGIWARDLQPSVHLKPDADNWAYLTSQVDGVVHSIWFNLSAGTPGNNTIPSGWVVHTRYRLKRMVPLRGQFHRGFFRRQQWFWTGNRRPTIRLRSDDRARSI